jgi:hypothetical protein
LVSTAIDIVGRRRCGKRRHFPQIFGEMRAPRQSLPAFSPAAGSPIDSQSSHHRRKDRGILGRFQYSHEIRSLPGRGNMTYRLCYEDKTASGNDGAQRIERFASEAAALIRARALLDENENYTMTILDDRGEVACGVRLQLKLGDRGD